MKSIFASLGLFVVVAGCSGSATPPPAHAVPVSQEPVTSESTAAAPTAAPTPTPTVAPTPATPAAVADGCPSGTTMATLDVTPIGKPKLGPFDLPTFSFAKAELKKEGTQLSVHISNGDWPVASMRQAHLFLKKQSDTVLTLTFYGKKQPVAAKEYGSGSAFFGKEEVQTSLYTATIARGMSTKGKATIVAMTDDSVCGTFELVSQYHDDNKISGTFVAPLVRVHP